MNDGKGGEVAGSGSGGKELADGGDGDEARGVFEGGNEVLAEGC